MGEYLCVSNIKRLEEPDILFISTLFVGASELTTALRTGKLLTYLGKIPKNILKFVKATKNLGFTISKKGYIFATKGGKAIAQITKNGKLKILYWIENIEIKLPLYKIESVDYITPNGQVFKGQLKIVKTRNGKIGVKKPKKVRATELEIKSPECAKHFRKSTELRNNIKNHAETKALYKEQFEKSGKTWDEFIKEYEAHHIIPVELLENSKELQYFFNNGGVLKFNTIDNGILVKKFLKSTGGIHANHPKYQRKIKETIAEIYSKTIINKTLKQETKIKLFQNRLYKKIKEIELLIKEDCIIKGTKINNLYK